MTGPGELLPAPPAELSPDHPAVEDFLITYRRAVANHRRAANTSRAYDTDWRQFSSWCASRGWEPLPAHEYTVLAYLHQHGYGLEGAPELRASTLERRLSGIAAAHRAAGAPFLRGDPAALAAVRDTVEVIARDQREGARRARALSRGLYRQILTGLPETPTGVRNAALIATGFLGALRRSELTGLDLRHLRFEEQGVALLLEASKTDQTARGRWVHIPFTRHRETCAVRRLRSWLTVRGRSPGPLFVNIRRGGHVGSNRLDDVRVNAILKAELAALGEDPGEYSAHSLRSGLVTAGAQEGAQVRTIMKQTGHVTYETVEGYMQDGRGYQDNVVNYLTDL